MNDNLPLRDVMRREFVGVAPSDTAASTARLLAAEEAAYAIVVQGGTPQGLLAPTALYEALAVEEDSERPVEAIMDPNPVVLAPDATVDEAASLLADISTGAIIVEDDGDALGLVTSSDVIGPLTTRATAEPANPSLRTGTARDQSGDEADDYSRQSVCEGCGTLTADLADFNGQLLCPDCRSV